MIPNLLQTVKTILRWFWLLVKHVLESKVHESSCLSMKKYDTKDILCLSMKKYDAKDILILTLGNSQTN